MVAFIFTCILMASLSAMLYLMVRALPRIAEDPHDERQGLLDKWARSHMPEKIDNALNGFLLKFLRRFRLVVLRLDNSVSQQLQKMNPRERDAKKIDFTEISGQNGNGADGEKESGAKEEAI